MIGYEAKASGNVQMVVSVSLALCQLLISVQKSFENNALISLLFPQTSQFTQNALNAKNKMNMLTNPTDDIVGLVTTLYNNSCTNTPAQNAPANPFGMGMGSTPMNSGTGASIFGGGSTTATNNTNLFGSPAQNTNASNPFARNTAGFGATTQSQPSSLFGAPTANSNSMNLFGAQSSTNTGGSLFGGSSFSNTNNPSTFGNTNQTASLFGGSGTGATSGPFSQQTNASPFALSAANNQPNSLFGGQQQQQSNPVFGGGATFGMQVKTGLFAQANSTMGQTSSGNIFGQNVQTPAFGAPAQINLFGSAPQNQAQSIFGGVGQQQQQTMQTQDNPFAAVAQSGTTNIFGGAQMQQQQPQATPFQSAANTFGANTNMSMGQSLFGGTNQPNQMNVAPALAQVPAQAPAQSLQQQQQSIFGTTNFSAQPAQTPFGGNAFQNAQEPQKNVFGVAATAAAPAPPVQQSKTLYTPMESLSQDEIDAFNNNTFDISKIPTKPPPMELCI